MKPSVGAILSTSNYAMFKPHGEQRDMHPNHIKKIARSMARNGFIQAKPLHCYRDGSFLRIIDGHHRLSAAKELGIAVYYVIGDKSQAELIADENTTVRKWGIADFVNMYAQRGDAHYILLNRYVQAGIPLPQAAALLSGLIIQNGHMNNAVASGTFVVKTTNKINTIVWAINELEHVTLVARSRVFISALSTLLFVDAFDVFQMVQKIKADPSSLVRKMTRDMMLEHMENVYNFRSRVRVPIAFLAQEQARDRNHQGTSNSQAAA